MQTKLSTGCIAQTMTSGPSAPFKVGSIVQVLGTKPVAANGTAAMGDGNRWRIAISDGTHVVNCLGSSHVSIMISQNMIPKSAIIQIDNSVAQIVSNRKIPVIVACKVLDLAAEKIGEPVPWIESSSANAPAAPSTGYPPLHQSNSPAFQANPTFPPNNSAPDFPPLGGSSYASTFQANPTYPGTNTSPPQNTAVNPYVSAPAYNPPPTAGNSNESDHVQAISSLTPYNNTWTVRGRITSKGEIKTFTRKDNREGKLFSFVLMDESMDIRVTGFDEVADSLYSRATIGRAYSLSNGKLKLANQKYNTTQCDYEITAERETRFEEIGSHQITGVPAIRINSTLLADLMNVAKDATCDISGIVILIGPVSTITSKATNRELLKRELTLVDSSGYSVPLTLWGAQAENFDGQVGQAVVVKAARVSDFNGRSLSVGSNSVFLVNPDIPEAHALIGWYQSSNKPSTWQSHSRTMSGGMDGGTASGVARDVMVQLSEATDPELGAGKGDYYSCVIEVTYVRNGTLAYPACPTCMKKVHQAGSGWHCEKCNQPHPRPQYRYIATVCGADATGQCWFQIFDDVGRILFSVDADRFMHLRETQPAEAQAVLDAALYKTFRLRVRVKQDNYMGEARARHSILEAVPVDCAEEFITAANTALHLIQEYEK